MSGPETSPQQQPDDWLSAVAGFSEMGRMIDAFDWTATPLGHQSEWPIALRTAASMCLTSRFPILLLWGPELINIYNDGYRGMISTKHPGALGTPVREVWPEIWHEIGPMFQHVLETGEPTWAEHHLLLIDRDGFPEECFFTFSYSPVYDGTTIAGILDVSVETTDEIVSVRRLECVALLTKQLSRAQQVTDVCVLALESFTASPVDIRAADIYLLVDDALVLVASNRRDDVAPLLADDLLMVLERNETIVSGWVDERMPAEHAAIPIGGAFGSVRGVLVTSLHHQRPFDATYREFLDLVADAISNALDGAFMRTVELGEYRRISDTLQAAMLKPASDLPTVAARYLPAIGNLAVGGDWYDVIELGGDRRALVVGDCVGHGLEAATAMAQLRSATRAMLYEGHDPARVLDRLDLFAETIDGAFCTTMICAIFDRNRGVVTYSSAGHPPPMLVNRDGVTWLDQVVGPPLAVTTRKVRANAQLDVDGDDIIVMYSDGLIERRGENLDTGFARLASAGAELYGSSVQEIADGLLRLLLPENTRDDVVLVVKRLATATDSVHVDADVGVSTGR